MVETSFLKFSQQAAGEKNFGKNTVAEPSFPDEKKKTVAETSFDWNLIFPRKTKKKKTISWSFFIFATESVAYFQICF